MHIVGFVANEPGVPATCYEWKRETSRIRAEAVHMIERWWMQKREEVVLPATVGGLVRLIIDDNERSLTDSVLNLWMIPTNSVLRRKLWECDIPVMSLLELVLRQPT
jgi:hypothetical protein